MTITKDMANAENFQVQSRKSQKPEVTAGFAAKL